LPRPRRVVGLDMDLPSLLAHRGHPAKADGEFPKTCRFPDGTFSLVTANMVVEHIENPGAAASGDSPHIARMEEFFVFHTPNLRHYKNLSKFAIARRGS